MPPLLPYMQHDMRETKVATCCYCGTRAALVLRGTDRHELACASCGAPLHDLKMLPKERGTTKRSASDRSHDRYQAERGKKAKKSKKKKSFKRRAFEEIFDVIEDIFD